MPRKHNHPSDPRTPAQARAREELLAVIKDFPPCSEQDLEAAEERDRGLVPFVIPAELMSKLKEIGRKPHVRTQHQSEGLKSSGQVRPTIKRKRELVED